MEKNTGVTALRIATNSPSHIARIATTKNTRMTIKEGVSMNMSRLKIDAAQDISNDQEKEDTNNMDLQRKEEKEKCFDE